MVLKLRTCANFFREKIESKNFSEKNSIQHRGSYGTSCKPTISSKNQGVYLGKNKVHILKMEICSIKRNFHFVFEKWKQIKSKYDSILVKLRA